MSKVNQQDIDKLIELVGGRGNIATVSHCITRLRFVLNDPAIAKPKEIEQLRMVKGCFTNAGQFQVVIGTEVGDYYKALLATTGQTSADKEQVKHDVRHRADEHRVHADARKALRRDEGVHAERQLDKDRAEGVDAHIVKRVADGILTCAEHQ